MLQRIDKSISPLPPTTPHELCDRCQGLNFWDSNFCVDYLVAELKERSSTCYFCRILYRACSRTGNAKRTSIQFDRVGSVLRIDRSSSPVLSICGTPGMSGLNNDLRTDPSPFSIKLMPTYWLFPCIRFGGNYSRYPTRVSETPRRWERGALRSGQTMA